MIYVGPSLFFRMITNVSILSLASGCFSTSDHVRSDGQRHCANLNPESALHLVSVCETTDTYTFKVLKSKIVYPKKVLRDAIRSYTYEVLKGSRFSLEFLKKSKVQVWLTAPVFLPKDATLVVVTMTDVGAFFFRVPVDVDHWSLEDRRIYLLGKDPYPSFRATRAGQIFVRSSEAVSRREFEAFLNDCGVSQKTPHWPLVILDVPLFGEVETIRKIATCPGANHHVADLDLVPAGDIEGAKAVAFTFPFLD